MNAKTDRNPSSAASEPRRLSSAVTGQTGVIVGVFADPSSNVGGVDCAELERRLLEAGFVEGARVTLLHEGPLGGDPIAVRLDDMRVAIRRREAHGVLVQFDGGA
jgi:ferrous iron transport protein A